MSENEIDLADLATIGAQIIELGLKLKELKAERGDLDAAIMAIETELMPLVVKHTKIIASITGVVLAPRQAAPAAPATPPPGQSPGGPQSIPKARIKDFIRTRAQEGMSAMDIADVLKVEPSLVRECITEIMQSRRGGGAG